jgi:gliding motility-associated lipoprotein GldD
MYRLQCFSSLFMAAVLFSACNSSFTQKPKGYAAIQLPEKKDYQAFSDPGFPYSFEYPAYAVILKDSSYFGEKPENPYSVNVEFPALKCKFYLSYKIIGGSTVYKVPDPLTGKYRDSSAVNTFDELLSQAFDLSAKNTVYKAAGGGDSLMRTPEGISGVFFKAEGNAASPMQFFVSDSARHFLRGSVYYDASPNSDSTGPVTRFLYPDLQRLINTLKWK